MEPNRVVFNAGAAVGIRRATALRLANDGCDIAVNDIASCKQLLDTLVDELSQKGRKVLPLIGDVSVEAEVQKMVEDVVQHLGGLDAMIANAGIFRFTGLVDSTVEEWDYMSSINVRGVFLCYKHAALQMIKQGRGGRIIGASSSAAKQGTPHAACYTASKFAVGGLTQATAGELGRYGITVNAYAAGPVDTPMIQDAAVQYGDREKFFDELVKSCPIGYIGHVDDVASIIAYLASKEAHFITGQSVSMNGGLFFD